MLRNHPRLTRIVLAATALAGATALALSSSASAAPAPTDVTFTLNAGGLAISAPATASASATLAPVTSLTAPVNGNSVTDTTGSLLGWTVTATATDLVGQAPLSGVTIDRQQMAWVSSNMTAGAGGTLVPNVAVGAGGPFAHVGTTDVPVVVAKALPLSGAGTYTYDGAVTLTVLPGTLAGAYKTTITQSLV